MSTRHQKLYPPGAYTNEETFRDLALPWGESAFDLRNSLAIPPNEISTLTTNYLVRNATGNLYWLGHDLMWTAGTLLRQGPVENIIGLDQALHHIVHVGLRETPIALNLQACAHKSNSRMSFRPRFETSTQTDWHDYQQNRGDAESGAGRFQSAPTLESRSKLTDSLIY